MVWYTGCSTGTQAGWSTCGLASSSKDVQWAKAQVKSCFWQLQVFNLCALWLQSPPISSSDVKGLQVGTCSRDLYSFEGSATVLFCNPNWLVGLETPDFPLLSWSSSLLREFLVTSGNFWWLLQAAESVCRRDKYLQREHSPRLKTPPKEGEESPFAILAG